MSGWIGVDLDGTLARYDGWRGVEHIGEPVAPMLERVKAWLAAGIDVRIFTARVGVEDFATRKLVAVAINGWCQQHFGRTLPITNVKDFGLVELWDDRAVQIIPNTGRRADGRPT